MFSISLGGLLFILFNTNFLAEYIELFGFGRYLYNYKEWRNQKGNQNFYLMSYIGDIYDNFGSRLLKCPVCLSYFLSLITGYYFLYNGTIAISIYLIICLLYKTLNRLM